MRTRSCVLSLVLVASLLSERAVARPFQMSLSDFMAWTSAVTLTTSGHGPACWDNVRLLLADPMDVINGYGVLPYSAVLGMNSGCIIGLALSGYITTKLVCHIGDRFYSVVRPKRSPSNLDDSVEVELIPLK